MTRLALLFSSLPLALAFSNTSPFLAWSSYSSSVIDRLPTPGTGVHSSHIYETILLEDDVCVHDAVILIEHPGLHASDLRNLPRESHVARSLSSASSSRQFAYIPNSDSPINLATFAESVSERCSSRLVFTAPGQGEGSYRSGEKSVIVVSMPEIEGNRKNVMMQHDSVIASTLSDLPFENHLVIYTGSSHNHHFKRQQDMTPDRPVLDLSPSSSFAPQENKEGILHNYQLLTPGLIVTLLVVVFVFLPVLYFGISALASIQSPLRIEVTPKGFNAGDKKNQ
ncbi:hypothetical protein Moror_10866 [Moniliophthora roreri MCA 2997]|uniref:Protein BIG1 n=2 Tax=Moniliophthora roreri TaxID=221103 RepID=V2X2A4_MONRO|nr:hypothetical protein Moror_10866 [Moniliophthora roreri MCA 2997]KAI3616893.1 hypothetical protein WG66_004154 [Moniliophthora roreri]